LCWSFLAIEASRSLAFAKETASFDEVLAATKPGYRALGLILYDESPAFMGFSVYGNFPVWYQAEKHGLVDYNFAHLAPQVIRYRPMENDSAHPDKMRAESTGRASTPVCTAIISFAAGHLRRSPTSPRENARRHC
jgi:hypothetical protein